MIDRAMIPRTILHKIDGLRWNEDNIGKSGSTIHLFDEMVLKIERITRNSEHEMKLLRWLEGKLPVPKIIEAEEQDGYRFLLMSKLPGEMACTGTSLRNMEETVSALANTLKMMWQINTADCPCTFTVSEKLMEAKDSIDNAMVDGSDFEPETLGPTAFANITDLYNYLKGNRPQEDLVFSHGDFTFANILISGSIVTGLIDWGNGGVADRWQDISLCYRGLRKKCEKYHLYSEKDYLRYKSLFFQQLGIEPDEEKIRYFNLLDEFF